MKPDAWPLYGLRIRTSRLELRLPDLELLDELAAVGAGGVHAPDAMPLTFRGPTARPPSAAGPSSSTCCPRSPAGPPTTGA